MLGERMKQIYKLLGTKQRRVAALLNLSESTLSAWRTRGKKVGEKKKDPDYRSLMTVSKTLMVDMNFLSGLTDEFLFIPPVYKVQAKLRSQAQSNPSLAQPTASKRLVAAWEAFHFLLPDFREDVWLTYIGWGPDDWQRCKEGRLPPTTVQIEWASRIIGLPERWFRDGSTAVLEDVRYEECREIARVLREEGLDIDDAIRLIRKNKDPRH